MNGKSLKASRPEPDKYGTVDFIPRVEGIPEVAVMPWEIHGDWVCREMDKDQTLYKN